MSMSSLATQGVEDGGATPEINAVVRERDGRRTTLLVAERELEDGTMREVLVVKGGETVARIQQCETEDGAVTRVHHL